MITTIFILSRALLSVQSRPHHIRGNFPTTAAIFTIHTAACIEKSEQKREKLNHTHEIPSRHLKNSFQSAITRTKLK